MTERRHVRRRRIPFVRSAVLQVGAKNPRGQPARPRAPREPSSPHASKFRRPSATASSCVSSSPVRERRRRCPCSLVWRNDSFDASSGRPAGIAVRFGKLDPDVLRRIQEFAADGFLPGIDPSPWEHLEYRVLERFRVDERELNTMGLDGWELCSTRNIPAGVQMVFLRRL